MRRRDDSEPQDGREQGMLNCGRPAGTAADRA